jgi:hypothetical protein
MTTEERLDKLEADLAKESKRIDRTSSKVVGIEDRAVSKATGTRKYNSTCFVRAPRN